MFTSYIISFSDNLEETADILLRELIESGKNFGDFIPKAFLLAPTGQTSNTDTHSNRRVPIEQVSILIPRQGRISECKQDPAPSKNSLTRDFRLIPPAIYQKTQRGPVSKKLLQDLV